MHGRQVEKCPDEGHLGKDQHKTCWQNMKGKTCEITSACLGMPFSCGDSVLAFLDLAEDASSDALRLVVPGAT